MAGKSSAARKAIEVKAHILIIESRYYEAVADALLEGALEELKASGATFEKILVPGALEIPAAIVIASDVAREPYAGAIALGCVIRGETYHFEIVAGESSRALMDISVSLPMPIGNGILTVENEDQAVVRANPRQGDKGGDAARAALALFRLSQRGVV